MTMTRGRIAERHIRDFFLGSIRGAVRNQDVQVRNGTIVYVAELLTHFARSRNLFEPQQGRSGLPTLTEFYVRAVEGPTRRERAQALQRLGDVALFIAGLFAGSLNRKVVDVDYYIAMGGNAYGQLSRQPDPSAGPPEVFHELSTHFAALVDILDEVGANAPGRGDHDVMRSYELWVRTGSRQAARRLQRHGVVPVAGSVSRRHH